MTTETKILPENIEIPTVSEKAGATGLLGFSSGLPSCPSRLPDGTILDYSAVDETWNDVDFPEREPKPKTIQEERAAIEAGIFTEFQESKRSQVTPAHLLKHITRVQSLAALVPAKTEAVAAKTGLSAWRSGKGKEESVEVVKFDKPELSEKTSQYMRTLQQRLSKAKAGMTKHKRGSPGWHAAATDDVAEASPEAQANKAKRREHELLTKVGQNAKAKTGLGSNPHAMSAPLAKPGTAKTWSKKGPGGTVHPQPGYFTWRAKQKKAAAAAQATP